MMSASTPHEGQRSQPQSALISPVLSKLLDQVGQKSDGKPTDEPLEMRPFRVLHDYDSTDDQILSVSTNDEGVVLYTRSNSSGQHFHFVEIPKRSVKGFIPAICAQVNESVRYGDVTLRQHTTTLASIESLEQRAQDYSATPLARAISAELRLWERSQSVIQLPETVYSLIETQHKRDAVLAVILNGCAKARTLDLINRTDFSWEELSRISPKAENDPGRGIYGSRYSNFMDKEKLDVARIGSADVISRRARDHVNRREDPEWPTERTHYDVARKAASFSHFTICYLDDPDVLLIAEQLFINLFEFYSPKLRSGRGISAPYTVATESDLRQSALVDEHTERWAAYKKFALRILMISNTAKVAASWHGGTSRPSFGVSHGVNVSSPLFEHEGYGVLHWVRCDVPGKCAIFTRTMTKARTDFNRLRLQERIHVMQFKHHRLRFPTTGVEPKPGTEVFIQFEIMLDGSRHPQPYANLPEIPVWDNYREANTVGITAYWEDSGLWHKKALTFLSPERIERDKNDRYIPGVHWGYVWALAWKRHLMHETVQNPSPWELKADFGLALVYQADFDNWTQQIVLNRFPMKAASVPSGAPTTLEAISTMLKNVGARFTRRIRYGQDLSEQHTFARCDWCMCSATSRICRPCGDSSKDQCDECRKRGLVCTYTRQSSQEGLIDDESPVEPNVAQYIWCDVPVVSNNIIDDPKLVICTPSARI